MECWGAQGGSYNSTLGGKGAYCFGILQIAQVTNIYIYVGSAGSASFTSNISNIFNGGGPSKYQIDYKDRRCFGTGGGATDIRLQNGNWDNFNSLKSRIMVAAAGGGIYYTTERSGRESCNGAYGGALTGGNGTTIVTEWGTGGTGGTQTAGGYDHGSPGTSAKIPTGVYNKGGFGFGGGGGGDEHPSAGGGGGYYGGGNTDIVGLGGSSYISGHTGCSTISGYVFCSTVMIDGGGREWVSATRGSAKSMPKPTGGTETGHSGNGYCKITWHPSL